MIRKFLAFFLVFNLTACAELQQVVNQLPQGGSILTNADMGAGLKQALDFSVVELANTSFLKATKTFQFHMLYWLYCCG